MNDLPDSDLFAREEQSSRARGVDLMRIFRGAVLQHAGAVHTGIDADKMRNPVLWPNRFCHINYDG